MGIVSRYCSLDTGRHETEDYVCGAGTVLQLGLHTLTHSESHWDVVENQASEIRKKGFP